MNSPAQVQFLIPLTIAKSTLLTKFHKKDFELHLQSRDKNIK